MSIVVLRIGHRIGRDERVTTHVGLVARAFGADKIIIPDEKIAQSLQKVIVNFGGPFSVEYEKNWKRVITTWDGVIVHLTMYGEKMDDVVSKLDTRKNILVVVGAEKVPSDLYHLATYNVSVGNQPHSEVAALAIFLDRFTSGKWIDKKFNGKLNIIPNKRGKTVVEIPR